jgi:hypothetical protein
MSKLLKRALKISIIPALLCIAGKFLGILAVSAIYNLNFQISNDLNGIFSVQIFFEDPSATLLVNSLSDILMVAVITIPLIYFITKTYIYNTTAKNPRTIVKLTRFNILKWITKKDTSFLTIFIWCAFLWLVSGITVAHTLLGQAYTWVGITAGSLLLLITLLSIKTFELETAKIYPIEH